MGEKVTLVGGGLAGSLMSIYLANRGYEVYIY
jgi:flavin-dependent dehydrogenase